MDHNEQQQQTKCAGNKAKPGPGSQVGLGPGILFRIVNTFEFFWHLIGDTIHVKDSADGGEQVFPH